MESPVNPTVISGLVRLAQNSMTSVLWVYLAIQVAPRRHLRRRLVLRLRRVRLPRRRHLRQRRRRQKAVYPDRFPAVGSAGRLFRAIPAGRARTARLIVRPAAEEAEEAAGAEEGASMEAL